MAKEHRCKDCRDWYGADPDGSASPTGALSRAFRPLGAAFPLGSSFGGARL